MYIQLKGSIFHYPKGNNIKQIIFANIFKLEHTTKFLKSGEKNVKALSPIR
jgi:hypothetical protein